MTLQRYEPLPHLEIQREPEERLIRPRQGFGARPPSRPNRQQHAAELASQAQSAVNLVAAGRERSGIDPQRLVVLRFETLEVDQRETLERLGVTIVEETEERREDRRIFRLLAQFPDQQALDRFRSEFSFYAEGTAATTALPYALRRDFFDSLESVSALSADERRGMRLRTEGVPDRPSFYLDVDLWNPGTPQGELEVINSLRTAVESQGGTLVGDPLRIPSLILAKVWGNESVLNLLLTLDLVSLVDLPPSPLPEEAFDIFAPVQLPDPLPSLPAMAPAACLLDSGVTSGHPLLQGVVANENDFGSGERTVTDLNGHGTQVGGLIVYGDIARQMVEGTWQPFVRLFSAKVLRNTPDPFGASDGFAEFPEEERAEEIIKRAIEHYHDSFGVRVFNLSIGHAGRVYGGGRQLPWAELLDDLARRLDIVIIVSAGNVPDPPIPDAMNSAQFQRETFQNVLSDDHRLIDPATSSLSVTVGSLARRADPSDGPTGIRLAASPARCPSPFTRRGPGVAGAVKPELVHFGGNYALESLAGQRRWRKNDPQLGEPSLNHAFSTTGRLLKATAGTSYSAAHVTHLAARLEGALTEQLRARPSANLIRCLLANSATVSTTLGEWVGPNLDIILKTIGYGQPTVDALWSFPNKVTLLTEDEVTLQCFHVYAVTIPEVFLRERGNRSITVTLAYDPPTRLSRRDYIANSMWLDVYRGLTTDQIINFRAQYQGTGEPPPVPDRNKLDFRPGGQTLRRSTLQSRSWHSNRSDKIDYRPDKGSEPTFHIFVGCRSEFPDPNGVERQRYALALTFRHESMRLDLYEELRNRVRTRVRVHP